MVMEGEMRKFLGAALICLLISGSALAGSLADNPGFAYDDGSTVWCETVSLTSGTLSVDVDYCVYTAGTAAVAFQGTGYAPTAGEFVYAYQADSSLGTAVLNSLSVGMLASNEANNIGTFDLGDGGTAPDTATFGGTPPNLDSANWSWLPSGGLLGVSSGLVYCSINAPMWWFGTAQNDTETATDFLPSPSDEIPEPATMTLLVLGTAALAIRRKR